MATQDDYIRTALRVPPELHAKIHVAAKENNRTFNAEIVARLEASFRSDAESDRQAASTSFAKPIAIDTFSEQMRLEIAIASLDSQARIAFNKLKKVQSSIDQIEAKLAKAEADANSDTARSLSSRLQDEVKWLREVEFEYISTQEEIAELKLQLAGVRN